MYHTLTNFLNHLSNLFLRLSYFVFVKFTADGRMDSPGHCAQYCTYTTMDNDTKEIISIVTVDKRETMRNSVIMEKEAFIRTVDQLLTEVNLKEICTDAHVQISALMSMWSYNVHLYLCVYVCYIQYVYIFCRPRSRKIQGRRDSPHSRHVAWSQRIGQENQCCMLYCKKSD